jgi:serine/threonine protein kinase
VKCYYFPCSNIKLTDFAMALDTSHYASGPKSPTQNQECKRTNDFVGTSDYVSIEMIRGHENISNAVDLWAFGCIFYYLLAGVTPFSAPSEYKTVERIIDFSNGNDKLLSLDAFHCEHADLVSSLLQISPEDRIGISDDVQIPPNLYNSIRNHSTFAGFDWEGLQNKQVRAPYQPSVPEWLSKTREGELKMRDGATEFDLWLMDL